MPHSQQKPRGRPTIRDVANAAGVSPSAVSFALNNRPGVSEKTREKIKAIAVEMGWTPNAAARALVSLQSKTIGFVLPGKQKNVSAERFFFGFIFGLQETLADAGYSLLFQFASSTKEECAIWKTWWSQNKIDGVVVINPTLRDGRKDFLEESNIPNVLIGIPNAIGSSVVANEEAIIESIITHLIDQGRTRITYIASDFQLVHALRRSGYFTIRGRELNVEIMYGGRATDGRLDGAVIVDNLLSATRIPDAIVFDNELLTVGGVKVINKYGYEVGKDIAVVSCEDSPICKILENGITSVGRDPAILGKHAGEALLAQLRDGTFHQCNEAVPELIVRASTMLRNEDA